MGKFKESNPWDGMQKSGWEDHGGLLENTVLVSNVILIYVTYIIYVTYMLIKLGNGRVFSNGRRMPFGSFFCCHSHPKCWLLLADHGITFQLAAAACRGWRSFESFQRALGAVLSRGFLSQGQGQRWGNLFDGFWLSLVKAWWMVWFWARNRTGTIYIWYIYIYDIYIIIYNYIYIYIIYIYIYIYHIRITSLKVSGLW